MFWGLMNLRLCNQQYFYRDTISRKVTNQHQISQSDPNLIPIWGTCSPHRTRYFIIIIITLIIIIIIIIINIFINIIIIINVDVLFPVN